MKQTTIKELNTTQEELIHKLKQFEKRSQDVEQEKKDFIKVVDVTFLLSFSFISLNIFTNYVMLLFAKDIFPDFTKLIFEDITK